MKTHRGSALLVVLGMLSFMIISGVAFSVYMRTTRLPSSFTRRVVSTRQLAKAALAEAIDQIDRAVANDPHPGVRYDSRLYNASTQTRRNDAGDTVSVFEPDKIDNFWAGRILVGQGGSTDDLNARSGVSVNGNTYYPKFVDPSETVPVLTLEALAYLPPSLVNEARYYGQRTPTAGWQTFDFDAGRYAYVAVDVSDYFDVNRAIANVARLSAPESRVTLSYMFEDGAHGKWVGGSDDWDSNNFMGQFRDVGDDGTFSFGSKVPLMSLADFNLAWGKKTIGEMKNPFCQYLQHGGSSGFYNASPSGSDEVGAFEKYGEMTFVTDSLEAPRSANEETVEAEDGTKVRVFDLDDENNQPFSEADIVQGNKNRNLLTVGKTVSTTFSRWCDERDSRVPRITMFALNDYLDRDRVPLSLGMPSVERVPMICGIQPILKTGGSLAVETRMDDDEVVSDSAKEEYRTVKRTIHWGLSKESLGDLFAGASVRVLVAYPFNNYEKENEDDLFKLDGRIQFFLSSQKMRLRTGGDPDTSGHLLHWGYKGTKRSGGANELIDKSVFNFSFESQDINYLSQIQDSDGLIQDPKKCVKAMTLSLPMEAKSVILSALSQENANDLLRVTYQWKQKKKKDDEGNVIGYENEFKEEIPKLGTADADVSIVDKGMELSPLTANGVIDTAFAANAIKMKDGTTIDSILYPNVTVCLRVTSKEDKVLRGLDGSEPMTVDMVPATNYDDFYMNGIQNSGLAGLYGKEISGEATPLLKFDMGVNLTVNPQVKSSGGLTVSVSPKSIVVDDPRYNHAPENWQELTVDGLSENDWYGAQTSGSNDGDILMASSDQAYLQSVYELAFLPRCSRLRAGDGGIRGRLSGYPSANASWTRLNQEAPVDKAVMWQTYDPFGRYDNGPDDFTGLGLENRGRGLRVNPFSNLKSVVMAAFANTPRDWVTASDQILDKQSAKTVSDAGEFNDQYAWNEYSKGGKISWPVLSAVADRFMSAVKTRAEKNDGNWKDALLDIFDQEGTYDTEKYLCGVDLSKGEYKPENGANAPIHSVDKKFLYGYWKSCFAARQQLYLVFFRAEPLALGGGVAGATPPQLGARGVALVWRDPYDPHERKSTSGSVTRYYPTSGGTTGGNNVYFPHRTRVLFYKQFE